jgi:hypothetical protein
VCHTDLNYSDTNESCKLRHTRVHSMAGRIWTTSKSCERLPVSAICCRMPYIRRIKYFVVSFCPCSAMYAMSSAKFRRYASRWVMLPMFGGFACGPTKPQALKHVDMAVKSLLLCTHIRLSMEGGARRFTNTSRSSYPPRFLGFWSFDIGTPKVAPIKIYHATAVVNCCVHATGTGKFAPYTRWWLRERNLY